MQTPLNQIELVDAECEDFLRHIDRKIMWKDQTRRDDENLSNGAVIEPLKTISTSHFWTKRNLQMLRGNTDSESECESEGLCFISGCNLIISKTKPDANNETKEVQRIIPIKTDCQVTSLFTSQSSTGESLVIVGEKLKPPILDSEYSNFVCSGRVEIINLDRKILDERRVLDHSYYVSYESFIYDAIVPFNSDLCLTILKNVDLAESDTKVFIWDYVHITVLAKEDFEHHIEQIVSNYKIANQFIFYSLYYCAVWSYSNTKKKLICENVYVNEYRDVADATFIKSSNFDGICIAFRANKLEIYTAAHKLYKTINLSDVYFNLTRTVESLNIMNNGLNNNIYPSNNTAGKSNNVNTNGTRVNPTGPVVNNNNNMFNIYEEEFVNINSMSNASASSFSGEIKIERTFEEMFKDSPLLATPNIVSILRQCKLDNKNSIKYIISRDKYIFIFFHDSNVYYIFEFVENLNLNSNSNDNVGTDADVIYTEADLNSSKLKTEEAEKLSANNTNTLKFNNLLTNGKDYKNLKLRLSSVEKLNYKLAENSSVLISQNLNNMTLIQINGEVSRSAFMNKFDDTRKTIFIQNKDKRNTQNFPFGSKINESARHKIDKVKMKYYQYGFSLKGKDKDKDKDTLQNKETLQHNQSSQSIPNNIPSSSIIPNNSEAPNFSYISEIYSNTGLGQGVTNLAVSSNPRLILVGYEKKQMNIFQQLNIDEVNTGEWNNQTSSIIYNNLDSVSLSPIAQYGHYLKRMTNVNFVSTKTFDHKIVSISISPMGNLFFVTYDETSCLYALLDREIKEMAKINSFCQAATFSKSGKMLAFGNTDNITERTEYNIIILNLITFEVEYIISKLPPPVKIMWLDNDTKIVALFQDTSTNILGWLLNEKKFMVNSSKDSNSKVAGNKNLSFASDQEQDLNLILKLTDYTEKILDIVYDDVIDYLLVCSEEKRVRVIHASKDDVYWEFPSDCKYYCVVLVKKLDIVIFGTSEGSIRICLWPITNFTSKDQIDHPQFTEKFLHSSSVNQLVYSSDLKFLYSSSLDGSIFISSLLCVYNDSLVTTTSFAYFDSKNSLPKKISMTYSDLIYMTDGVYKNKLENIDKRQTDIQIIHSEFMSEMEKLMGENAKNIDKKRHEMNEDIDKKRRAVKNLEDQKEILTKQLKEKRISQDRQFRDVLGKIKIKYKIEKENLQIQTKNLTGKIKDAKSDFAKEVSRIEGKRDDNNTKIKNSLEGLLKLLNEKFIHVENMIKSKKDTFNKELDKVEKDYETHIKEKDGKINVDKKNCEEITNEMQGEISKTKKDNQNYDDKIKEWESHLVELKNNNTDLMESFLFNTLKLKQMNNLLKENEKKISENESEVKKHRTVNDRLEQLRYVLEYQITNLIKEKNPIEEQIRNFEELHNEFYKRFNLLYAEQLNLDDFISNNDQLIENFKDQLAKKKQNLYHLKNLFRTIDLGINSIFRDKIDDKVFIMNKLVDIYNKNLKDYNDEESPNSQSNSEMKMKSKLIEKEINKQKNKVLGELINRRQNRITIHKEKDELMIDIRLENQQLIEECSSIRMNLEDILKYITDIEKKFIELTNTHLFLNKNENAKLIRNDIKNAKKSIMLADTEKTRIAKGSNKYDSSAKAFEISPQPANNKNNDRDKDKFNNTGTIFQKLEENKEEIKTQNAQIEKMQKKIKELIGENVNVVSSAGNVKVPLQVQKRQINSSGNNIDSVGPLYKNNVQSLDNNNLAETVMSFPSKSSFQPKASISNEKLKNSRLLTIKSKYYDSGSGGIKEIVNSDEIYVLKKKK